MRAFQKAVTDVFKRQAKLAYREQLKVSLLGDPERVTQIRADQEPGSVNHTRQGKIDEYKKRLERYNAMAADVRQNFQQDHLEKEWKRIQELRVELIGPVKQMETDMQTAARGILTEEQRTKGQVAIGPSTQIDQIDQATMWALMVIGMLLIVGFFSRLSALAGGLLILSFYLARPPWPGVPPAPGPEHSLIVNKNLIEVLALFCLAFIPTGKYFGIDAIFIGLFGGGAPDSGSSSGIRASSMTLASNKKKSGKPASRSPAERVVQAKQSDVPAEPPAPPVTANATSSKETYSIRPQNS